jgi:hypothetical protein
MSNSFLTPLIVAKEAIAILENNLVLGQLVYRDYSGEFVGGVGDTVNVRRLNTQLAHTHNGTTATVDNISETVVPITMNTLLYKDFAITAKERTLSIQNFSQQVIEPAAKAIAQAIDYNIASLWTGIPYYKTVSATPVVSDIAGVAEKMSLNKCPFSDRYLVLDPTTNTKYSTLPQIQAAYARGNSVTSDTNNIGHFLGFDGYIDQNIQTSTVGTFTGSGCTVTGASGATTISTTGSGTFNAGDIFTIAGVTGTTFVATAAMTTGAGTVTIYPALPSAVSSAAVTIVAGGINNLAFNKNAFAFVNRPVAAPMGVPNCVQIDYNGISITVAFSWNNDLKADICSIMCLTGYGILNPELSCRFIG